MTPFQVYSNYYDLLYQDKDYESEADFIHSLLVRHHDNPQKVLELGCGTGKHATLLAQKGLNILGIDRSESMLENAVASRADLPKELTDRLQFEQGDIREFRTDQKFDAVLSLFHVFSYQTTNEDLKRAFETAKAHLAPGGILIFDCWYGPAVLTDRPAKRIKRLENELITVTRDAVPVLHPEENRVDVNYKIRITQKDSGAVEELEETHQMRYLFTPEIELFARHAGFEVIDTMEWMTGDKPGFDTWGVCFVCRR